MDDFASSTLVLSSIFVWLRHFDSFDANNLPT